jgi:hypothetical protein
MEGQKGKGGKEGRRETEGRQMGGRVGCVLTCGSSDAKISTTKSWSTWREIIVGTASPVGGGSSARREMKVVRPCACRGWVIPLLDA